ncbi:hypothetical protein PCASD_19199 [Puccinia coronata f. sp. avenae]|uniref:Uncharacterized protein n=1 Tax=Puccinia coronata f. sp. avenae TaxID=200324 RepID=A0A2N5UKE1_9BASI|nr:hypothetical protein PCASD_19199 [Puccinia coronata f. sp. avenae]
MKSSLVIVSAPTNPSCWAQADSSTSHTTLSSISHNLRRKEPTKSKGTRALFFGQEQLHKLQWLLERFLGKEGLPPSQASWKDYLCWTDSISIKASFPRSPQAAYWVLKDGS